ncbi:MULTISPECIES: hypothetical protein [Pseudomonas]|uniref:Uncharacterized protein n=1 Tax=Pseudomonas quercus TaxID=2722792 RepID=A0ABX0YHH5_9PSED|nr:MULTISPECIES: hypothetical protein [Pseudomonas]MBF7143327.1 hypothetical protein [Pseudomonas sp. LY10J]NJP01631.1 hypothetical protein [Pseudomonas quercus]
MNRHSAPTGANRREMRKALIRLRMEMHRQEIRQSSRQMINPLSRFRTMGQGLGKNLGVRHAPLWGVGMVSLLGFLSGKGARKGGIGTVGKLTKLAVSLVPLLKLLQSASRR